MHLMIAVVFPFGTECQRIKEKSPACPNGQSMSVGRIRMVLNQFRE